MNKMTKSISYLMIAVFLLTGTAFAAEKVFFYHTDPAGTPLAMTDTSGTVVWEADYKPFGEEYGVTPYPENNKMFVGKEKDKETGLYYFGARYIKAEIGRFVSPDPVGAVDPWTGLPNEIVLHNPQRLNPYAYGLNNPYRYVDPDGETPWDVLDIGFFAHSVYKVATDPSWSTVGDLGLNALGLFPLIPSPGTVKLVGKGIDKAIDATNAGKKATGRVGKQTRLRELAKDPKVSSADRGQIKRDIKEIERGKRKNIRVPQGKNLAHRRGFEAKKGYSYKQSDLQSTDIHKLQHKHEGY